MPPRTTALSTSLRSWRCPQCTYTAHRTISTSNPKQAFGPEHPRYITVPEPPQQTLPYHPLVKGRLPVPRSVFHGRTSLDEDVVADKIAQSTKLPKIQKPVEAGSHQEWKQKQSAARRRNLQEGLLSLRHRKIKQRAETTLKRATEAAESLALQSAPEREDERLTAPTHGLDLEKLMHGPLPDPTREKRLQHKRSNLRIHTAASRSDRLENLHTLYMNARSFIVTPEQLDAAIEEEFDPMKFRGKGGYVMGNYGGGSENSMWNFGPPVTVQDLLSRRVAGGVGGGVGGGGIVTAEVSEERVRRIGEKLTGGKMDKKG